MLTLSALRWNASNFGPSDEPSTLMLWDTWEVWPGLSLWQEFASFIQMVVLRQLFHAFSGFSLHGNGLVQWCSSILTKWLMLGIQRLAFELTLESKKKGYLSQARFLFQKNKHHIMPIITPAYPSMCSTHNILQSTMKVLLAELTRASTIVDKIILGTTTWQELFVEHNFFELYKHYIRISVCSNMPDLQISWQVQPL